MPSTINNNSLLFVVAGENSAKNIVAQNVNSTIVTNYLSIIALNFEYAFSQVKDLI